MQTIPEMVETYRSNSATDSYPSDVALQEAHTQRNEDLYERILATPLMDLEDGPAKISAIFMWHDGDRMEKTTQAEIVRIAESMERLARQARP